MGVLGGWEKWVNLYRSSLRYETDKVHNGIFLFSTSVATFCIIQLHDELANLKLEDLNCRVCSLNIINLNKWLLTAPM